MIRTQFSPKFKKIQFDSGGDYIYAPFQEFLASKGTQFQYLRTPYIIKCLAIEQGQVWEE